MSFSVYPLSPLLLTEQSSSTTVLFWSKRSKMKPFLLVLLFKKLQARRQVDVEHAKQWKVYKLKIA